MIYKTGLSPILQSIYSPSTRNTGVSTNVQIGKVFGVITTENTPTKELFMRHGKFSGVGTVFYLEYNDTTKNVNTLSDEELSKCAKAIPYFSNIQDYPLIGELIYIIDGPSSSTQDYSGYIQKYYLGSINLWNNNQQNAPGIGELGKYFNENVDVRRLTAFEGDRIYQGRKGNGIRFSSTVKSKSNINEWSSIGNDGDPITIIVNGYVTIDTQSLALNIEEINKEKSSIYMTSTQAIPLKPGASIINPQTFTIKPEDYSDSQIILNSDRVTLNSKKDEVLLFAKTNIELNTDNIINLNSGKITHINSPTIILGTNKNGSYANEPALLGDKTHDVLIQLCLALKTIAGYLAKTTIPTSDGAICITDCNAGGETLLTDLDKLLSKIDRITSNKVFLS